MSANGDAAQTADLDDREVGFAIVLVRDVPLGRVPGLVQHVLRCVQVAGGDVLSFDASMILVAFGRTSGEPEDRGERLAFVGELQRTVGADVSFVHGRRRALVGDLGLAGFRRSFTFLFEGYRECLAQLVALPVGAGREI